MMKNTATLGLIVALGLLVGLTGCESLFSDDAETVDREAMLAEYGGFDTSDEMAAFGDSELAASYADEVEFEDEMEDSGAVRNAHRNGAKQYMLRVIWGNIQRPDTTEDAEGPDCPITDWSGSLVISGGVATVKRLIRFEDPLDHIVRPRPGPREVAWVSFTSPHLDGILFKVLDTHDPQGKEVTNSLTITTPQYSVEIPLDDLADYNELVEIDGCNSISIVATEPEHRGCPTGFIEGGWSAETDSSGYLKGAWISNRGDLAGYLQATYDTVEGERVLHGKWITESGEFAGLIRGTWRPAESDSCPDGFFEARWVDDYFVIRGLLKGHYHLDPESEEGSFHGRWRKLCR